MKTKKHLRQGIFALMLAVAGFAVSPISVRAISIGGAIDSNGNFTLGAGTSASVVNSALGANGGYATGGGWALSNPYGLPQGSILGIVSNLLFWLLALFAVTGIIGFVLSGIFYLLAGADEGNAEKGKNGMKWSIIGIIVGLSGYVIMQAVTIFLGASSSNF